MVIGQCIGKFAIGELDDVPIETPIEPPIKPPIGRPVTVALIGNVATCASGTLAVAPDKPGKPDKPDKPGQGPKQ